MANEQINIRLSPEVINMMNGLCITDRGKIERGALIEALVREKWAAVMQPQKRIEAVRDAKDKLIGWRGLYGDHEVCMFHGAGSRREAEMALDAFVYEELSK